MLSFSKISQIFQETKHYLEHKLIYLHRNEKITYNKKLPEKNLQPAKNKTSCTDYNSRMVNFYILRKFNFTENTQNCKICENKFPQELLLLK